MLLAERLGIPHISSGDLFRAHIAQGTSLGKIASQYIGGGNFVPDDLTCQMMRERMAQPDCQNGYVLDGFPRNLHQAEVFDSILAKDEESLSTVVLITLPREVILHRLSDRRVCPDCGRSYNQKRLKPLRDGYCDDCQRPLIQRDDDKEETVLHRLDVYEKMTAPLVQYYLERKLLMRIDNQAPTKETLERLLEIFATEDAALSS